jgi:hypothetical protein
MRRVFIAGGLSVLACASGGGGGKDSGDSADTAAPAVTEGDCKLTLEVQSACSGCISKVAYHVADSQGQEYDATIQAAESRTYNAWSGDITIDWQIYTETACDDAEGERSGTETVTCDEDSGGEYTYTFYCTYG